MKTTQQFLAASRKPRQERVFGLVLAALFLGTNLPAHAAGDPKAGKAAAAVCLACHGQNGISPNPLWPNLAGQKEDYLVKQLKAFRSEERKDPVMGPQAKALGDSEIENLAAFFAGIASGNVNGER